MSLKTLTSAQKKRLLRAAAGFAVLGLVSLLWPHTQLGKKLEQETLDYRYAHFNRAAKASDQVVVIDLDEQTFKLLGPTYGRWPWPRRIYKELIEFLSIGEPSSVIFDLLFTEAQQGTTDDELLAEVSGQTGLASHALKFIPDAALEGEDAAALPADFAAKHGLKLKAPETQSPRGLASGLRVYRDFLLPNPALLAKAPRLHVVTTEQDSDGSYRRVPIVFRYGETWLPSLTLRALLSRFNDPALSVAGGALRIQDEGQEPLTIPIDRDGTYRVHYYRDEQRPESISFAAVLASAAALQKGDVQDPAQLKVNPLEFKGKTIVIGASATGLEDLKVTPVSTGYPGVLIHASAISNLIDKDFLRPTPVALQFGLVLLTLALIYGVTFVSTHPARFLVPPAWLALVTGAGIAAFQSKGIWLELARPLALGGLAFFDSLAYLILIESRDKKKLKDSLSKYLPPSMADEIIASGQDPRAEVGHQAELTILFSDVRGFTTLSEKTEPKTLVSILNEYLGRMTDVVFEKGGTLDKFIGDAVMAFWGAPLRDPAHALRAVECALKMREALATLNGEWETRKIQPFEVGIGINTGEVIVGNIGSEKRLDYTVIGDNVNLASRLEGLTKQYKASILLGPKTEESVKDSIICRPIDFVRVKGKAHHVKIFEALGSISDPAAAKKKELAERFAEALEDYRTGKFEAARGMFTRLQSEFQDGPSEVFALRCQELIEEPPRDWDGIFTAKSK
ncbi:MAG: adenylate/guanylate cyclase domain-containing protein [Oligoflexia bacterium]|nr:adenylate/guanylate cyclase domain-containing protein [Oligoflexia bacterium]